MSIFRKTSTSAMIAMSLAMLAACGGGGGGSDATNSTAPPPSTQTDNNTNNNVVTAAPKASYAYITQRGWKDLPGSILKCKVDDTPGAKGALTDCGPSGADKVEGPISLTFVGDRAYVVNKEVGAIALSDKWEDVDNYTHSIWMCSVNPDSGALFGCANTGQKESVHIDDFFVSGGYGYMLQKYGDMILRCGVKEEGALTTNLVDRTPDTDDGPNGSINGIGLKEPVNYAFIPEKNRVYIANSMLDGSSISLCTLNPNAQGPTGEIGGCVDANVSSFRFGTPGITDGVQPTGIAINDKGSMAYIVSQANKNVISCNVGSDGRFTSCTANTLGVPVDILNRVAVQDKYVYITNTSHEANTGSLIKCEMAANGKLKDCTVTGQPFDSGDMNPSKSEAPGRIYNAIDSNGSDIKFLYSDTQQ